MRLAAPELCLVGKLSPYRALAVFVCECLHGIIEFFDSFRPVQEWLLNECLCCCRLPMPCTSSDSDLIDSSTGLNGVPTRNLLDSISSFPILTTCVPLTPTETSFAHSWIAIALTSWNWNGIPSPILFGSIRYGSCYLASRRVTSWRVTHDFSCFHCNAPGFQFDSPI